MTSNFEESTWTFWRQYEKADIIFSVIDSNYEYMNRLQVQIGRKWGMIRKVENFATLFRWNFQESEQISSSKKFFIWSIEAFTAFRIYRKWREELEDDCRKVEMRWTMNTEVNRVWTGSNLIEEVAENRRCSGNEFRKKLAKHCYPPCQKISLQSILFT